MARRSESIDRLTDEFAKMPGIGRRTAARLAYYVQSVSREEAAKLVDAIQAVKAKSLTCSRCYNVAETDPCPICTDAGRDQTTLCVVELVRDLSAIEASGGYRGLYHVLGGRIAPLDDVYPENLTIAQLLRRVTKEGIKEVIIATNPDTEGDSTANAIIEKLAPLRVTVTVLARGVPSGSHLEHAAGNTLAGAIRGRQPVKR